MSPGPQKQFDPAEALEKAMRVFWQHGYAGASMSQLMSEMCIGKKSLYDTFGNKRELFLKALDLYGAQSLQNVKEILNRPGSPLGNLRALFASFQESECKGCFFGTNMADFDLDDAQVSERLCQHLRNLEGAVQEALLKARQAGEIGPEVNTESTAKLLSCLGQGVALVGRVGKCHTREEDALKAAFELLERSAK